MSILKVEGLSKKYDKTPILQDIGFTLDKGEVISIIGSSGSGKTTLLRCLNFLEFADTGRIYINSDLIYDGENKECKKESNIKKSRLHFGLVFQSFNLFPQYSVLENIMLAPRLLKISSEKEIRSNAIELLDKVGLSNKADSYPCKLSGGQQQRVAIARALALSPEILCFDEPTSALDPELTDEVLRVIYDLKCNGKTMIIVTHEMDFARKISDKIIFMCDGKIEEEGTPSEIFEYPESEKTKQFISYAVDR